MAASEGKMQEETIPKEENEVEDKNQTLFDMIAFDLGLLKSSNNAKDNKMGMKIVRHIKNLRRKISGFHLKRLWDILSPESTCPEIIAKETQETQLKINLDDELIKHPYSKIYLEALTLSYLLRDESQNSAALELSNSLINNVRHLTKWMLDHFWSYIYYLFARAQEKNGVLTKSRTLYRTASLSKNSNSQATLLNLILRCFILTNDYKSASEFIKHTLFPENKMNNEFTKYLYYTARIKAVQLRYREAFTRVTQALRKSPENAALGFRVAAQKLAIVVEMLMGDIPSRGIFVEGEVSKYLFPYYELTRSLVRGEVKVFEEVINKHKDTFQNDGLLILIKRLTLNVIRAGLKRINLSYSRISFSDIRKKLALPESADVESMVAKAIRDAVITANIDFKERNLVINENNDVYSTREPQSNFQKRIEYCINMINNCQNAMMYKQNEKVDKKDDNEDDDDDDFDALQKILEQFEDEFM